MTENNNGWAGAQEKSTIADDTRSSGLALPNLQYFSYLGSTYLITRLPASSRPIVT